MQKHYANILSLFGLILTLTVLILVNYEILKPIYLLGAIFIYVIIDLADGIIARVFCKEDEEKKMGEFIDALSDLVNFGIVPVYLLLNKFTEFEYLLFLSSFFILAAVYRLARFNANKQLNEKYYLGLPTTIAGPIWSIAIFITNNLPFAIVAGMFLAVGMISTIKIKKIKFNLRTKRNLNE